MHRPHAQTRRALFQTELQVSAPGSLAENSTLTTSSTPPPLLMEAESGIRQKSKTTAWHVAASERRAEIPCGAHPVQPAHGARHASFSKAQCTLPSMQKKSGVRSSLCSPHPTSPNLQHCAGAAAPLPAVPLRDCDLFPKPPSSGLQSDVRLKWPRLGGHRTPVLLEHHDGEMLFVHLRTQGRTEM